MTRFRRYSLDTCWRVGGAFPQEIVRCTGPTQVPRRSPARSATRHLKFATSRKISLMVPRHEAAYGQKPVERLLRQLGEAGHSGLGLETARVEHSGEMAMEIGQFSAATRKADGTIAPERGKNVKVWRRLGAWLIIADCWSRTVEAANDLAA